jgi:outer membrane lipoprotein SlyB
MNKKLTLIILLAGTALLLSACAKKRPVLYPNATYQAAGETVARGDIDDCIQMAADHGHATDAGKNVAKSTAAGAAVGAAVGGAVGLVTGRPGRGLAAGAAGGGAGGMTRGALKSGNPDEIERRFVEQCLRDKGYQVIGWK